MSTRKKPLTAAIQDTLIICTFETQGVVKSDDLVDIKSTLAEDSADLHDVIQAYLATYNIVTGGILHLNDHVVHMTGYLDGHETVDAFDNANHKLKKLANTITKNHTQVLDRYARAVETGGFVNVRPNDNQTLKLNDRLWNIKQSNDAVIFFPGPCGFELSPVDPKHLRATSDTNERIISLRDCLFTGIRPSTSIMDAFQSDHIKIPWIITLEGSDEVSEISTSLSLADARQLIIASTRIDARVSRCGKSRAKCIDSFVASNPDGAKIIANE